ncbi:hypothetical protein BZM26_29600 [Paraburkholderia strydomiana]|nr:hypothetical protein BZM26_29600 [Paraburkholderia strydomiana]
MNRYCIDDSGLLHLMSGAANCASRRVIAGRPAEQWLGSAGSTGEASPALRYSWQKLASFLVVETI